MLFLCQKLKKVPKMLPVHTNELLDKKRDFWNSVYNSVHLFRQWCSKRVAATLSKKVTFTTTIIKRLDRASPARRDDIRKVNKGRVKSVTWVAGEEESSFIFSYSRQKNSWAYLLSRARNNKVKRFVCSRWRHTYIHQNIQIQ